MSRQLNGKLGKGSKWVRASADYPRRTNAYRIRHWDSAFFPVIGKLTELRTVSTSSEVYTILAKTKNHLNFASILYILASSFRERGVHITHLTRILKNGLEHFSVGWDFFKILDSSCAYNHSQTEWEMRARSKLLTKNIQRVSSRSGSNSLPSFSLNGTCETLQGTCLNEAVRMARLTRLVEESGFYYVMSSRQSSVLLYFSSSKLKIWGHENGKVNNSQNRVFKIGN